MATITITFTPPSPVPANGYRVNYRKVGDTVYTTLSPNPTTSPVTITGVLAGVAYEGTIESDCGGTYSTPISWSASAAPKCATISLTATYPGVQSGATNKWYPELSSSVLFSDDVAYTIEWRDPLTVAWSFYSEVLHLNGVTTVTGTTYVETDPASTAEFRVSSVTPTTSTNSGVVYSTDPNATCATDGGGAA